jgi:GH15 family glucan-1,4-alpha-glucosidase
MYSIEGEPYLPERVLGHLDGYAGSRPVRVGNDAAAQRQLDVFGEVLDWAFLRTSLGGKLDPDEASYLQALADYVSDHWQDPDQGIWEVRSRARNFTHGKAMAWAALDRARRLFGDRASWRSARDEILAALINEGTRGDPPYLSRAFDGDGTDAALLQLPLLGLPLANDLLAGTVRKIEKDLRSGDFVHRYHGEDGLCGDEGAFLVTSFWLVDALLVQNRAKEARALFERLLAYANDVGLYSEEVEPSSGQLLGNFPQAFTHLGLISSATLLHLYDLAGSKGLQGTHADRARRLVGATEGWKALFYALLRNRGVRLRSSSRSILALT